MSISPVNCTPIKPQTSFGKEIGFDDVERLYDDSRKYDEFSKKSANELQNKSLFQTFASVVVALAATYVGGKLLASKALELFPNASGKIVQGVKNLGNSLLNKTEQLANSKCNKNIAKFGKKANEALELLKAKTIDAMKKDGADNLIKKAAGVASIVGLAPKVVTADGNSDGIADIAQEGINAYKSALDEVAVVSDIIKATT